MTFIVTPVPSHKPKNTSAMVPSAQPSRPAFGSQVTIQSEQEKQLKKFFRKEEKKLAKQAKEAQNIDPSAAQYQFNPELLKRER